MWHGTTARVWSVEHLRAANEAAGVALWSWTIATDEIALDQHALELWGLPRAERLTFKALSAHIHPADLGRVTAAFAATRVGTGAYEIDFRVLHECGIRWISARGQRGSRGIVDGIMLAVFLDVTDRKLADEGREMLASEMSHRIKNLFAIAAALTGIAARSATTTTEMARDLTQRLSALGRAHSFIHPATEPAEADKQLLGDLLAVLLAPYAEDRSGRARVHVLVPDVRVGESSVTTLALIVHELATNAVKYGALSAPDGILDISRMMFGEDFAIVWTERGGPPVASSRGAAGFGSKLVAQSMAGKLGGSVSYDWQREGLVVTLRMRKDRLAA